MTKTANADAEFVRDLLRARKASSATADFSTPKLPRK
jgi:hypothetical protein